jgi:Tfp pilus assembly protein PilN
MQGIVMQRIELDFIERRRPVWYVGFSLFLVAIAVAAYLTHVYFQNTTELNGWESRWHGLKREQERMATVAPHQGPEWERMQVELKLANQVIGHLALPWDGLFHGIEASMDGKVSLLSIEPDTEKREIQITAEAKSFQDMVGYMANLRANRSFKDAYIVSHHVQQSDPQKPVRFEINAQWTDQPQMQNISQEKEEPLLPKSSSVMDKASMLTLSLDKRLSR